MGLSPDSLKALAEMKIHTPTPIQSLVIPAMLKGKNVMCAAQTGTGKTLSYLLPVLQRMKEDEEKHGIKTRPNRPRALILLPNRELSVQVLSVAKQLSHHLKFRSCVLTGGAKEAPQTRALETGVDLCVTTPGRFLLHREKEHLFFTDVRYVVVDEADTLLSKDFLDDVEKIIHPPKYRLEHANQNVQFSFVLATLNDSVQKYISKSFPNVELLKTKTLHTPPSSVRQLFVPTQGKDKLDELLAILHSSTAEAESIGGSSSRLGKSAAGSAKPRRTLVFCNTVPSCRATEHFLRENGIKTASYHGEILPETREESFASFLRGDADVLVCTDIAARGLDTTMVDHVINFDFPLNTVDYLHRVGRTGRAGTKGSVTSLLTKRDMVLARAIEEAVKRGSSLQGLSSDKKDYAPKTPLDRLPSISTTPRRNSSPKKSGFVRQRGSESSAGFVRQRGNESSAGFVRQRGNESSASEAPRRGGAFPERTRRAPTSPPTPRSNERSANNWRAKSVTTERGAGDWRATRNTSRGSSPADTRSKSRDERGPSRDEKRFGPNTNRTKPNNFNAKQPKLPTRAPKRAEVASDSKPKKIRLAAKHRGKTGSQLRREQLKNRSERRQAARESGSGRRRE